MSPERIKRAAEILRERAHNFRCLCTRDDGQWLDRRTQRHHDEMLALAAELDGLAEERTTDGWLAYMPPVDGCGCLRCTKERTPYGPSDLPIEVTHMFFCETCGNKRCPHSDDHSNPCTGSNDPGQPGSRFA